MDATDLTVLADAVSGVAVDDETRERYAHDDAEWADYAPPAAVIFAQSLEEVVTTVRFAAERGIPVIPRGAGTGLSGGANATAGSIVLSLERMTAIREVNVPERYAVVEAGVLNDDLRAIVSVDQTPKMLNTSDWPYGFYGYDETNRDTYFAERIPDTGTGTPLWRRGLRLVRLLRAMSGGGERELTPGELTLLRDHATADWRPDIAVAAVPTLFVAGAESEFWPSGHAVAAAQMAPHGAAVVLADDGHAANIEQPKAFNRALLRFLA